MDIYFAGSIRGGRENQGVMHEIVTYLATKGSVLTEHIGDESLTDQGELDTSDEDIYRRDMKWIGRADIFVAEVTTPSLGVGYEIREAERQELPILCLYTPQEGKLLSGMLTGNTGLTIKEYHTSQELTTHIDKFFEQHSG